MAVRRGDLTETVVARGSLEALDQVKVVAEVSGHVTDVYVRVGDSVEAGQPLCRLDPEHWQLVVGRAEAQLAADQAALDAARKALEGAEVALRRGEQRAASNPRAHAALEPLQAAVTKARADEQLAGSQLTVATAALDTARVALERTLIRAPMSGVVLSRVVEPGQALTAAVSAPVVFILARDLRRMELRVFVPEADLEKLAVGQSAAFTVPERLDRRFVARLTSIRNVPLQHGSSVGFEARLEVDNSDAMLTPDMHADVSITTRERKAAVLVPNAALRFEPESVLIAEQRSVARFFRSARFEQPPHAPGSRQLWVLASGGEPRPRSVTLGVSDGSWSEVLDDGVQPGDVVAIDMHWRQP